jgi:hypothetical protein
MARTWFRRISSDRSGREMLRPAQRLRRPPAPRRRQRRGGAVIGGPPVPAPSQDQDTRRFQAEAPASIQASIEEGPLQVSSGSDESEAGPSKLARDTSKEA